MNIKIKFERIEEGNSNRYVGSFKSKEYGFYPHQDYNTKKYDWRDSGEFTRLIEAAELVSDSKVTVDYSELEKALVDKKASDEKERIESNIIALTKRYNHVLGKMKEFVEQYPNDDTAIMTMSEYIKNRKHDYCGLGFPNAEVIKTAKLNNGTELKVNYEIGFESKNTRRYSSNDSGVTVWIICQCLNKNCELPTGYRVNNYDGVINKGKPSKITTVVRKINEHFSSAVRQFNLAEENNKWQDNQDKIKADAIKKIELPVGKYYNNSFKLDTDKSKIKDEYERGIIQFKVGVADADEPYITGITFEKGVSIELFNKIAKLYDEELKGKV